MTSCFFIYTLKVLLKSKKIYSNIIQICTCKYIQINNHAYIHIVLVRISNVEAIILLYGDIMITATVIKNNHLIDLAHLQFSPLLSWWNGGIQANMVLEK